MKKYLDFFKKISYNIIGTRVAPEKKLVHFLFQLYKYGLNYEGQVK